MDKKIKTPFNKVIAAIDALNAQDPNYVIVDGEQFPKELLYSQRMTRQLERFENEASQELKIAARAQHICRWKSPREDYSMNRVGYLKWREDLKKMHAELTGTILKEFHYTETFIDRVQFLIKKKLIKKDLESQTLEDVICLVFLEFYFEDFAAKHEEEKVIDIVQKTWAKMSDKGHDTALTLPLSDTSLELINKALA
ncbi:DUF4202 domain-containing protein [Leeuwenhoekiella sp. MAR_2009_132]|uniref:DUF4202 domain-containing protein n=1 Tax=Leeuwenhoekiella sp. MAR_2009_132 TaxID=1392489 RepID=UPI000A8750F7|nr:DUF4202 domain-containing protein [Leeuwenhoekiella sp. MAR_2009_132]